MLHLTNIRQLLPAIEGKPEFIVIDRGDYKVIDYVYQTADTFNTPEAMECRGIKFDRDGLLIARPFRKFFNYGEQGTHLPIERPHVVMEKLDGSMIHPAVVNGLLVLMTRKGMTDVSKKASERFLWQPNYSRFMLEMIHAGWTPIFEYIGPENRVVLRYNKSELVLLAIRHMYTGGLLAHGEVCAEAKPYEIPVVGALDSGIIDLDQFIAQTRAMENAEGFVVQFYDGHMVKVKAEDYVLKHRALDDMGSKKKVVALCCQGFSDDVLPILSEPDRDELLEFNHQVQHQVNLICFEISTQKLRVEAEGYTRKEAAELIAPRFGSFTPAFFKALDGDDPRKHVLRIIERKPELIEAPWRGQ
jgi:RNA ligase